MKQYTPTEPKIMRQFLVVDDNGIRKDEYIQMTDELYQKILKAYNDEKET